MPVQLNYDKAFIIRHGHYASSKGINTLSEKGRTQIKHIAGLMDKFELKNPTAFSSTERRTLETLFAIQDELGEKMLYFQRTHDNLYGETNESKIIEFIEYANKFKVSKQILITTHREMVDWLPQYIMKNQFQKEFWEEFDYGEGVYLDLKTGEITELRQPKENATG